MTDTAFKLATVSTGGAPFVAMFIDDAAFALEPLYKGWRQGQRGGAIHGIGSIRLLLDDWEPSFEALCGMAAFAAAGNAPDAAIATDGLHYLPPIIRPGKMMYAAANYGGHIREMVAAGTAKTDDERDSMLDRDKKRVRPYSFLKAPSALNGAYDDIVMPPGEPKVDWEVELALAIGRAAKRVPAEKTMEHVAGFMTTNDISERVWNMREDWPTLRTDWFGGKSHDTFAPMGPFFVPRAFVPNYMELRLTLKVNGEPMQDGITGEMVFSPEEQIEHCSNLITLEPGDVLSTGTPEGVGHGRGVYLKAGDVVEAEVEGLGAQRNNVVAAPAGE